MALRPPAYQMEVDRPVSPDEKHDSMAKHIVAKATDIPAGSRLLVEVKGRPIVIFNIKGEFFALFNRCPHEGGSLAKGHLIGLVESSEPGKYCYSREGEILRCPWHGWEFDVRTGKSHCDPEKVKTRTFPVHAQPGSKVVEGPYVAETFKVDLDGEYVVLEM